jgi:hypothetical protein
MSKRRKRDSGNPANSVHPADPAAAAAAAAIDAVVAAALSAAMQPVEADGDRLLADALNEFEDGATDDADRVCRRYALAIGLCRFAEEGFAGPDQDWRPATTGPAGRPVPANETTIKPTRNLQGQLAGARMMAAALNHNMDTARAVWFAVVDADDPGGIREMSCTLAIVKTVAALIIDDAQKAGRLTPEEEARWESRRPWPARP